MEINDEMYKHLFLMDVDTEEENEIQPQPNQEDIETINELNCELEGIFGAIDKEDAQEEIDRNIYLTKKLPNRTFDQLPDPIGSYMGVIYNPHFGCTEQHLITVYPPEPSPMANLKPAFAFGTR